MKTHIPAVIPRFVPEHSVLPAKYDGEGNLVRSYPGDPQAIGWTVFTRECDSYKHTGDALYPTEREVLAFLKEWRGITIRLNWNPSEPRY
jgi:hypothetical protein